MKYRIKIIETLSKVVEVEADDYDSAFEKVEEMVNCEEVVLTADDFDNMDDFNEVVTFAREVMQGNFREEKIESTTDKGSAK